MQYYHTHWWSGCVQNILSKRGDNAYKLHNSFRNHLIMEMLSRKKGIWIFPAWYISVPLTFTEGLSVDCRLEHTSLSVASGFFCTEVSFRPVSWLQWWLSVLRHPMLSQLGVSVHLQSTWRGGCSFFTVPFCAWSSPLSSSWPRTNCTHPESLSQSSSCLSCFCKPPQRPRFGVNHIPLGGFFLFCCCVNLVLLLFIQLFGKHKNGCLKCLKAWSKPVLFGISLNAFLLP